MPGGAPPRRRLEVRGELLTLREIAERYGIPYRAIHDRYYAQCLEGEDLIKPLRKTTTEIIDACKATGLSAPAMRYRKATGKDLYAPARPRLSEEELALLDRISRETGIARNVLNTRYYRGWRGEKLRQPARRCICKSIDRDLEDWLPASRNRKSA
ncbi:hypothetical protein [Pseudomonas sp. JUb52]|uniref:hypothetical protein n=1 Tax=Pseudomonas sp. JUb52 TaxID=2485127 RepID=UPI0010469A88|nr:hypothetical protein [Pseudomonas sp. JUb52]TCQ94075.1 hypothetical protein EC839_101196 [Pseudomonas sp. JUb52]